MESGCLSKHNSSLFIFMILFILMVGWIQGSYIEDEKKTLLEIKASLHELSNYFDVDNLLPTWVDHGSTSGRYCDWERIKCNTTSGFVTDLSLGNMFSMEDASYQDDDWSPPARRMIWPLNISLFLHFKELRRLDLSWNYIGNTFMSTGLEISSGLKKLENLNLSFNYIETNIFPSLSELTSLKILDLTYINLYRGASPTHDISEFQVLENLEVLNLTGCGCYGTLQMQGSVSAFTLKKLKILSLGINNFDESLVTSLSKLSSLETLDLHRNLLSGSFPSKELSKLSNLKKLDLSENYNFNISPSIQDCESLMRLKRLESLSLAGNYFNKSIILCLSFLPSLSNLDLNHNSDLGSSFPMQELSSLRELKMLDLSSCDIRSLTLKGTIMSNLLHLNLGYNEFLSVNDIMKSMAAFPSLRFLSLEHCFFSHKGERLLAIEVPNLPYLEVLILSGNNFNGTLPMEALASFQHLEVLDLAYNNFVGSIPSTIKSFFSLKVVSLAGNALNGALTNDGLCDLKSLQELDLSYNMFDGNLPECFNRLLSLKFLDISSNQFTGILPPSLIINLTSLEYVDFSHNKFEGSFSFSSFSSHTNLEYFLFENNTGQFEVETEEPIGWIPMFQLKFLVLSNCNLRRPKGSVVPSFLLHQHKLRVLDLSHNSFEGRLPNWLLKNNTNLKVLKLRNNSFRGVIHMGYENANLQLLDMSANHITGTIPNNIQNFIPFIHFLDFSSNALNGVVPRSIQDLNELVALDLSNNELSGEVPEGLLTNLSSLEVIKLSKNKLYGHVLSGNLSLGNNIEGLQLDDNVFTGNIGNNTSEQRFLSVLDISDNLFTGRIPSWMTSTCGYSGYCELVVRNNRLEGQFPCGENFFWFLDISQNSFSGLIPSCLNLEYMKHLHLGSNRFSGLVPNSFRNLTNVLTLDISHNYLSGKIPEFLGELSNLRILLLGNNKFFGSIPEQLCQLNDVSLIDISSNSLTGLIPRCLQNINGPNKKLAFIPEIIDGYGSPYFEYGGLIPHIITISYFYRFETRDKVQFTTKSNSLTYKGNILDYMSGLDLSCNKLTGEIPEELGMLTHILSLNLSHNKLTGPIPVNFSNLAKIESLDLSSNNLSGAVPSELIKLTSLAVLNVSYNNLSGKLPDLKAQFATFTKESYEGNPFLCGQPLDKCTTAPHVSDSSTKEGNEKWYDIDKGSFYGSSGSAWFLVMLGFVAILYINPYWRRRWLQFVEECMYACYYFVYDLVWNPYMLFHR